MMRGLFHVKSLASIPMNTHICDAGEPILGRQRVWYVQLVASMEGQA